MNVSELRVNRVVDATSGQTLIDPLGKNNAWTADVNRAVTAATIPSKAEFDAAVDANRAAYAGSGECAQRNDLFEGFVINAINGYGDRSYGNRAYPTNKKLGNMLHGPLDAHAFPWRGRDSYYNVKGVVHYISGATTQTGANHSSTIDTDVLNFNHSGVPTVETNGNAISKAYNIGDYIYLNDPNHEFLPGATFAQQATNWRAWRGYELVSVVGGALVVDTNVTLGQPTGDMCGGVIIDAYVPQGCNCEFVVVHDAGYSMGCDVYESTGSVGRPGKLSSVTLPNGRVRTIWSLPMGARKITMHSYTNTKPAGSAVAGTTMTIYSASVKQVAPANCIVNKPLAAGSSLYAGLTAYGSTPCITGSPDMARKDLVILESFRKQISGGGMVYPYGNVQYTYPTFPRMPNPTAGTFVGADTFSQFGPWQTPGTIVGKGWIWDNLTPAQQQILASDKRNNIYSDGVNVYQACYRMRAISGITNKDYVSLRQINYSGTGYSVRAGNDVWYVRNQGAGNDVVEYGVDNGNIMYLGYDYGSDKGSFGSAACLSVPIMVVQRRNGGVYHPVHNPDGCAMAMGTNAAGAAIAVPWHDAKGLTSTAACYDPLNIATVDPANPTGTAAPYSQLLAGTAPATHQLTGSVLTDYSGRPDGKCSDEIHSTDCEDRRMNSRPMGDMKAYLDRKMYRLRHGMFWHTEQAMRFEKAYSGITVGGPAVNEVAWGRYGTRFRFPSTLSAGGTAANGVYPEFMFQGTDTSYGGVILVGDNGNVMPIGCVGHQRGSNGSAYFTTGDRDQVGAIARFNRLFPAGTVLDVYTTRLRMTRSTQSDTAHVIYGHPEPLSCRKLLSTTATAQTIAVGDIVLSGINYYVANVARTAVNMTTEVYTNVTNWSNLGTNGAIGGYPLEWFTNGIDGLPCLSGYDGSSMDLSQHRLGKLGGYALPLPRNTFKNPHYHPLLKVLITHNGVTKEIPVNASYPALISAGNTIGYYTELTDFLYINFEGTGKHNPHLEQTAIVEVFYTSPARISGPSSSGDVRCVGECYHTNYYGWQYGQCLFTALADVACHAVYTGGKYGIHNTFAISEYSRGGSNDLNSSAWGTGLTHPVITPGNNSDNKTLKVIPAIVTQARVPYMRLYYQTIVKDNAVMNVDGTPTNTWGDNGFINTHLAGRTTIRDVNGNPISTGRIDIRLDKFFDDDNL